MNEKKNLLLNFTNSLNLTYYLGTLNGSVENIPLTRETGLYQNA